MFISTILVCYIIYKTLVAIVLIQYYNHLCIIFIVIIVYLHRVVIADVPGTLPALYSSHSPVPAS